MRILFVLTILSLSGCESSNEEVLFTFTEMQCVEYAWEDSDDDGMWTQNIKAYLEDERITVNRIEALRDSLDHCEACVVCPTGRSIRVWIDEGDEVLMDILGFEEE